MDWFTVLLMQQRIKERGTTLSGIPAAQMTDGDIAAEYAQYVNELNTTAGGRSPSADEVKDAETVPALPPIPQT